MKRWVIADTHFGHQVMITKGYRPADYNERIFRNWIGQVGEDDLIIHLGDVAIPDSSKEIWERIGFLPGRKILVMGNHDNRSVSWYMQRGFAFACEAFEFGKIVFTHAPLDIIPTHIRYNVHGHLHEGTHRDFVPGPRHRLVSLEELGYTPVLIERIAK